MIEIQTYIHNIPIRRNFVENLPYNERLKERAKKLRKASNFPEVIFLKQVRAKTFWKIDFDRQRIIGNYIVYFYIKTLGLIIEIDGSSHNEKDIYDEKRDLYLSSLDLRIFRISSLRVLHDLDIVMKELEDFIIKNYGLR